MLRKTSVPVAMLLGLGALANGAFMLWNPGTWYFAIPGVTSTGPFNQHFIRDIGMIFALVGMAYLAGVVAERFRTILWATPTLWLCGHALFHFWEVAVGICGSSALTRDFPAVTLPAALGALITIGAASADRAVKPIA